MTTPLTINDHVTIPASEMVWEAVRASGPGGQNVNKVSSKVELRFDLARTTAFDELTRARMREQCATRLDAQGRVLITSQKTRDQHRNLEDAREKLRELVLRALERPRTRRPTRPSRAAKARRMADKRHNAARKQNRRGGGGSE